MALRPLPKGLASIEALEESCQSGCKRLVGNMEELFEALRQQISLRLRLQELPIREQARLLLGTDVLLAVFGASLAWMPLLKPGSYVVEMHPGPPEALTRLKQTGSDSQRSKLRFRQTVGLGLAFRVWVFVVGPKTWFQSNRLRFPNMTWIMSSRTGFGRTWVSQLAKII